ncbi:MAG TPA: methyltransferase domain-containing protein [Burkholderiales bacterium]
MNLERRHLVGRGVAGLALLGLAPLAGAQGTPPTGAQGTPAPGADYKPAIGQPGKDVIWVPTQPAMVERMLRMAQVTSGDVVVDLGSGDGRIPIAAAREFGARARGIEYNGDLVALSRRLAAQAGVGGRATFEQADLFGIDFSDATVVTMFLLPSLLQRLRPILQKMKPGTRLVANQFDLGDWEPDEDSDIGGRLCHLWIVPARAGGRWKIDIPATRSFDLALTQAFQRVLGWVTLAQGRGGLRDVRLTGERLRFALVDDKGLLFEFDGRISGTQLRGDVRIAGGAPAPFTGERTGD